MSERSKLWDAREQAQINSQIYAVEVAVALPLLLLGGIVVAFTILGDLQQVALGRRYLFNFSPTVKAFMISYLVMLVGFDFLYAVLTGTLPL